MNGVLSARHARRLAVSVSLSLIAGACARGAGSSSPSGDELELVGISAPDGAVWQINREIEFSFSRPIDFGTVSSNTIHIRSVAGVPATGTFRFRELDGDGDGVVDSTDERVIVFQPNCPVAADYSDAGLRPGGVEYLLSIPGGEDGASNTLRSQDGRVLAGSHEGRLVTPVTQQRNALFVDGAAGPPVPVLRRRGESATVEGVTYVEVGRDPDPATRIFFELDADTQEVRAVPGPRAPSTVPLNLYADEATRVALVLELDQAVDPSPANLSDRRLRLEFADAVGDWHPIQTRVDLVANCTRTGARLRLEPEGLLPAGSRFRAVILPGFQDIVGESRLTALDGFAVAPTAVLAYASLADPSAGADELLETFDFGGDGRGSREDTDSLFETPRAKWSDGALVSAFDFAGTGGPGGTFDWVIDGPATIDTSTDFLVGGPNGIPTATQVVLGGVVEVRNLHVTPTGVLRVQGPHPLVVHATGWVRIEGELDASGFHAKDVAAFGNGTLPETGAAGAAGGGRGGRASEVITSSTPRGGRGQGPFGEPDTGAEGGESAYSPGPVDTRRPGGGGGGRFTADLDPDTWGLHAREGYPGHASSSGAESRLSPARGGKPGRGPFHDGDPANDFLGTKPLVEPDGAGGYRLSGLLRGELSRPWAGYGGGGGGDACPAASFPTPNWTAASDDKGGGGGGGGGAVRIQALGEIRFAGLGVLRSQGGHGGAGGNSSFTDHIGGTGGSGSGGHVLLESATRVDFTGGEPGLPSSVRVNLRGGPSYTGPLVPRDNVPLGISHGGSGGPGLLQVHVPSILPPASNAELSDLIVSDDALARPDPLAAHVRGHAVQLLPTFGARSRARSRWIPLGGAGVDPAGGERLVRLLFDGIEIEPGPDQGKVATRDGRVRDLAPLFGPVALPDVDLELLEDGAALRVTGAVLDELRLDAGPRSNDLYLRTPELLRHFCLRAEDAADSARVLELEVTGARYDDHAVALVLELEMATETLGSFVATTSAPSLSLIPRFFRLSTGGRADVLPESAFVRVRFEGAGDDGAGGPQEAEPVVPWTSDVRDFDALAPGALRFFRFEVEFDLDAAGRGVAPGTKPVRLEILRIPFRF